MSDITPKELLELFDQLAHERAERNAAVVERDQAWNEAAKMRVLLREARSVILSENKDGYGPLIKRIDARLRAPRWRQWACEFDMAEAEAAYDGAIDLTCWITHEMEKLSKQGKGVGHWYEKFQSLQKVNKFIATIRKLIRDRKA